MDSANASGSPGTGRSDASAASASTATAAVKIAASCTLTSTGGGNYSATVPNGTSAEIPGSTLSVSCNDAGGFALYALKVLIITEKMQLLCINK